MKHRFRHLLTNSETSETPSVDVEIHGIELDLIKATFDSLEDQDDELPYGGGFDNSDDGDGDDEDDGEGDDEDEAYLQDKLDVASDEASILSDAHVIFQKDPNTGKTLMICRINEMEVPDEYLDGKTMFKADVIFRSFREYSCPKKMIDNIDSTIFKKKNWRVGGRS